MSPLFLIAYGIALFAPIILFVAILNNANERSPFAVFAVCIALFGIAGAITGPAADKLKWVIWSAIVGVLEAVFLVFLV